MARRYTQSVAALMIASALLGAAGCGDDGDTNADSGGGENTSVTEETLDPAAVEASVEEQLATDSYAGDLSATVDCGDEATDSRLECSISGDNGLTGTVTATPSEGISYTGQITGTQGPSLIGGSTDRGSVDDVGGAEAYINESLRDEPGSPTADCTEAPQGGQLECTLSGGGSSGSVTVTPLGGYEWEGRIETPRGIRPFAGNATA